MAAFAKLSILVFGLLSAVFGGIATGFGVYLLRYAPKEYKLLGEEISDTVAYVFISIGVWLFATGMLGAGAVARGETRSMMLFAGTTAIISAGMIGSSIIGSFYHEHSQYYISFMINKTLQSYGTAVINTKFIDYIHYSFNCCGITEMHHEWEHVFNRSRVPDSCCLDYNATDCGKNNQLIWFSRLHNDPCPMAIYEYLYDEYKTLLIIMYGISLAFTFITALTATNARTISLEVFAKKEEKKNV